MQNLQHVLRQYSPHTNLATITAKEATCSEPGNNLYYYCMDCNNFLKEDKKTVTTVKAETTQSLKHSWGAWMDVGDGVNHTRTCKRSGCGVTETAAHSGGTATCTEKATCKTCGLKYGDLLDHDLIDHAAQAPTCTDIGWDAYQTCARCDYTTYAEKNPHHDLTDHAAQAPTCTAIGWDAYQTCSRCDYTTYTEKPALGHSEVTDTAKTPTCTDNGLTEGTHCFRCGQVLIAQQVIPALGHDYAVTHCTITRIYYQCSRCGGSYWIDNAKSRNL